MVARLSDSVSTKPTSCRQFKMSYAHVNMANISIWKMEMALPGLIDSPAAFLFSQISMTVPFGVLKAFTKLRHCFCLSSCSLSGGKVYFIPSNETEDRQNFMKPNGE